MDNLSRYSDNGTARTCMECASQRAENLSILGVRTVLELCVGPSLRSLEEAYAKHGIKVTGNDIDPRWEGYYPNGKWVIGDARKVNTKGYDAVVVAPPLSKSCSGKREDSLSLEQVFPSYYDFLDIKVPVVVYVLPGRTLSVREDRSQLHKFLSHLQGKTEIVPLRKKVVKYLDLYVLSYNS